MIRLSEEVEPGDDSNSPMVSSLELVEDGVALGPPHAAHARIRSLGRGLFSHWRDYLYFSTSDGSDPTANGRVYAITAERSFGNEARRETGEPETDAAFPRLAAIAGEIQAGNRFGSADLLYNPAGEIAERVQMLEAKVEYLLDELYTAKSQLRHLTPQSEIMTHLKRYQLETFDFQWKHLPYHDAFLTNPEWRSKAVPDICHRLEKAPDWFNGKRILDCGCGPGRYAWAFLTAGARVTAFDMSENGLTAARAACADFPEALFERRNILESLPYGRDFDLVWCYGVVHCTGDTFAAIANIAKHVRPGGLIYLMVYSEPDRSDLNSYRYYHEVYVIRQLTQHLSFEERAEFLRRHFGERYALGCFDAISSIVNDLYRFEELSDLLKFLGFANIKRTAVDENSLNIVATREPVP
jgi:SAM-dependent methyltransferase